MKRQFFFFRNRLESQLVSRPDSGDSRVRDGGCTEYHLSHAHFSQFAPLHALAHMCVVLHSDHVSILAQGEPSRSLQCASLSKESIMSLLNPPGLSAHRSASQSPWTLSTLTTPWLTRAPSTGQATPQGKRMSGALANPIPLTGYEPNFDVKINHECTPIIFPDSRDPFQTEQGFTTDVVSEASSSREA